MKLKIISALLFILFLSACQDVVEVDVPQREPELVVDGWITDSLPVEVKLSTTDAFFAGGSTPVVSGAGVRLMENGIEVESLMEIDSLPGTYRGNFTGTVGNRYSLRVDVPAGFPGKVSGQWSSRPEKLKRVAQIDSMRTQRLSRNTQPPAFREGDYALLYFQEIPGEGDYMKISRWLDDSLFQRSTVVFEDLGIDGQYFGQGVVPPVSIYGPFEEKPGQDEQLLEVRFESITESYADFLQLLAQQTNVGSPFDAPPALVLGNIHRQGDTADYAFGYFRASALSRDSVSYQGE